MKKHLSRIAISVTAMVCVAFAVCVTAFAETISYSAAYDYSKNTVTVSGAMNGGGQYITLQILSADKTYADLEKNPLDTSLVLYRNQQDTETGEYLFTAEYPENITSGSYEAYLVTDGTEERTKIELRLVSAGDYEKILRDLNEFAKNDDFNGFIGAVSANEAKLGFDLSLYKKLKSADAMKGYFDFCKENPLTSENSQNNTREFNLFTLGAALSEGLVSNIDQYIHDTSIISSAIYEDYTEAAKEVYAQNYITQKMSGKASKDKAEFERLLQEAVILNQIRYSDGYGDVKEFLTKYGSAIGITGTASDEVYRAMSGQEYKDGVAVRSAYEKLKGELTDGKPSGGSGGGGGGGSSANYGRGMNAAYPSASDDVILEIKHIYFNDIDGVAWASEAIIALADKKIINGKSEGYFNPDDFVTREEFAKILVGAIGCADEAWEQNMFADVSTDDWFCGFVNIAYEKGLIKGIGDGLFGTGQTISRQDMCVMLYNALKRNGVDTPGEALVFDDKGEIADYAAEAIGALYEMKIVNGISETEFDPNGNATRAQAAKIIYGALKYLQ